jgi:hypothetical protein
MLSGILMLTAFGLPSAHAQSSADARFAEKTRAQVQRLGVGRDARAEIKLRDETKLKGYVSAADGDSFTLTDAKTGASQRVAYADVAQVKKPGGGISTRTWAIIGAAAVAAVIVGVTVVKPVVCDGGAGC